MEVEATEEVGWVSLLGLVKLEGNRKSVAHSDHLLDVVGWRW